MKIGKRLILNTWISLSIIVLIATSLVWSIREMQRTGRNDALTHEMQRVALDRAQYRDYYLRNRTDRAKVQWSIMSDKLKQLLDSASEIFTDEEDQALLREARSSYNATVSTFSEILALHQRNASEPKMTADTESRISQLFLKYYAFQDSIDRLNESTGRADEKARNKVLLLTIFLIAAGVSAVAVNSFTLNRSVTQRLTALNKGLGIIGDGNLEYRIETQGNDEISDLGRSGNEMTAKLKRALDDLQGEVRERVQTEEALRTSEKALLAAKTQLEDRVRERTAELNASLSELEMRRHELRKLASELVVAEERERKRVAGILHDEIAQTLAAARMRLDLLQDIHPDQHDRKTLKDAKALLEQSIAETRALMNDLGNPVLFDLGLGPACESLADQLMERHAVQIYCDIRETYKQLDADVKALLYQIIRELLNNVVKHSQARHAHVTIDMEYGHVRMQVKDNGVGFDPQLLGVPTIEGGFGLYSIRERLIAMDGSLRIESTQGAGTVVTAIVPETLGG
jgi:signal transduction histidine kinase